MGLRSYEESLSMLSMPHEIYRLEPGGYGAAGLLTAALGATVQTISGLLGMSQAQKQQQALNESAQKMERDKMLVQAAIANRQSDIMAQQAANTPYYIVGGIVVLGIMASIIKRRK
jgi:hypothetical protein